MLINYSFSAILYYIIDVVDEVSVGEHIIKT